MTRLFIVATLLSLALGRPQATTSVTDNGAVHVDGFSTVTGTPTVQTITFTKFSSDNIILVTQTNTVYPKGYSLSDVSVPNEGTGVVHTALPTFSSAAVDDGSTSSAHSGAIAGGVLGAVAVALIAAIVLYRYRNKRSPNHWRNKSFRWQNLDDKIQPVATPDPYGDRPYDGTNKPPVTPLSAPIFIREKHRPAANDPFSDPHASPNGGSARGHRRNQSSFGSFGGGHYRDESVEMTPTKDKDQLI